jgi:hypothetical protein
MVAALCSHVMFATCAIGGIHYGTGRHMDTLSGEQQFKAMRVCLDLRIRFGHNTNSKYSTGGSATSHTAGR